MRTLIVLVFSLVSWETYSQRPRDFAVDKTLDYEIKGEGRSFKIAGENFTSKSDVQISYLPDKYNLLVMPLVKATKIGDTLQLTLEAINEAIYSVCTIKIFGKKCLITFSFTESGETGGPRELPIYNFSLILNHNNFKKGKTIRGHAEFRGRCLTGYCPDYVRDFSANGNFVVTI